MELSAIEMQAKEIKRLQKELDGLKEQVGGLKKERETLSASLESERNVTRSLRAKIEEVKHSRKTAEAAFDAMDFCSKEELQEYCIELKAQWEVRENNLKKAIKEGDELWSELDKKFRTLEVKNEALQKSNKEAEYAFFLWKQELDTAAQKTEYWSMCYIALCAFFSEAGFVIPDGLKIEAKVIQQTSGLCGPLPGRPGITIPVPAYAHLTYKQDGNWDWDSATYCNDAEYRINQKLKEKFQN